MWKFYKFDIGFGFDIYDIMSDTLGALLGAFIYILFNLATLFS
jgi:glycopeptide antibiotics resistance protein